jgi:hypothetical protein
MGAAAIADRCSHVHSLAAATPHAATSTSSGTTSVEFPQSDQPPDATQAGCVVLHQALGLSFSFDENEVSK